MQQRMNSGRRHVPGMLVLCLCCSLSLLAPAALAAPACGALQVSNAWVRVVSGAPVAAGYLEMHNPGDTAITVVAVASPQFGRVHMHESITDDNGMTTMQPIASVSVAAGQRLAFAPGGYHLMLFDAQRKLASGDHVTLQLQCAGADDRLQVTAEVRSMMPKHDNGMHMHHDG